MMFILKVIAGFITFYFLFMIVKELIKIAKERDEYDDKIDLP